MKQFFFFVVLSFNGFSQTLPSGEEIYRFTDQFVSGNDSLTVRLELNAVMENLYNDSSSFFSDTTHFSHADFDYFRSQLRANEKFKWDETRLTQVKTLSGKTLKWIFRNHKKGWKRFHRKYDKACLVSCSVPIFSIDRTYCIFYCGVLCDGLLGRGSTDIYKWEKGKWVYLNSYGMWVS